MPNEVSPGAYKPQETKKLTSWISEPDVVDLKNDLDAAAKYQNTHINRVADWVDCYNAEGNYAAPDVRGRSKVAPKLVRKLAEWRAPALTEPFLSRPDLFQVDPVSFEDSAAAEQNQLILNYQFRTKIGLTRFIDNYIRTATQEGTAILRTGWDYEEKTVKESKPVYEYLPDEQMRQVYEQLIPQIQQNPAINAFMDPSVIAGLRYYQSTGNPVKAIIVRYESVDAVKVIRNQPTVEVCDIDSIYVDQSCNGILDRAKFLIYAFETSMADLKADGSYENLEHVNVQNATQATSTLSSGRLSKVPTTEFKDEERKRIVAYEYWGYHDIHDNGVLCPVVLTWVGNVLIKAEENPFPDGKFPFVFVPMLPIKNSLYGEPDAELLKDNQKILGATTRGMIDLLAKSANGQTGFAKGFLDPVNLDRYSKGENYMFNPVARVENGIYTHQFPEVSQSALTMNAYWTEDAESMAGVAAKNTKSSTSNSGDSIQSTRSAGDSASKRELSLIRRLSDGLIEIAKKFTAYNGMFLSEDDFIRVTNKEFVPVRPDDLQGDFDFKINISTAEEDAAKTEELAFLLQTGQNSFPFEFVKMILAKISRLRKMPDLANYIEQYQPEPDPVAEQMKQLALLKAQKEIQLLEAQTQEALTKANVHTAEVDVRGARANNIQSNTDNADLKFYRDANSIGHKEEMDKLTKQSENQVVQSGLKNLDEMDKLRFNHNSELALTHAQATLNPTKPVNK